MKKWFFTALFVPLATVCLAAARDIPVGNRVDITGVENIKVSSAVTVHFTQGTASTVLVKENGAVSSKVQVSGNTLIIKLPALDDADAKGSRSVGGSVILWGGKSYDVRTEVFVTLPCLRSVSNSCSLEFLAKEPVSTARGRLKMSNSGSMRVTLAAITGTDGSSLDIDNSGAFTLNMGKTEAGAVSIDNSGSLNVEIESIRSDGDVTLKNSGYMRGSIAKVTANALTCSNSGSVELGDMAVTAPRVEYKNSGADTQGASLRAVTKQLRVSNSGSMNHDFEVSGGGDTRDAVLDFNNNGVADSDIRFRGDAASISTDGSGKVKAKVDCTTLAVTADGVVDISVSGKADSLTISGNEERVDTADLKCGKTTKMEPKNKWKPLKGRHNDEPNQYNP